MLCLTPKAQGAYVIPFIVSFCQVALGPSYESFSPNLDLSDLREETYLNIPLPITQLSILGRFSVSICLMI